MKVIQSLVSKEKRFLSLDLKCFFLILVRVYDDNLLNEVLGNASVKIWTGKKDAKQLCIDKEATTQFLGNITRIY